MRNLGNAFAVRKFESWRMERLDNMNFADTNLTNLIAVLQRYGAPRRRAIFAIYPFIVYEQMKFNRRACAGRPRIDYQSGRAFAAITKRL